MNWRFFGVLVVTGAVGVAAAMPALVTMIPPAKQPTPPIPLLVLAGIAQTVVLVSIASWAGIRCSRTTGFDAPILHAVADGAPMPEGLGRRFAEAIAVGTAGSAVTLAVLLALRSRVPALLWTRPIAPSFFRDASTAFYGGLVEELLLRWGVLQGLLWLTRGRAFWLANFVAALLFGLAHLPAIHTLGIPLTGPVLAFVLLGNGLLGLAFGWLFRKSGLESAMASHATADVWLHAVVPMAM